MERKLVVLIIIRFVLLIGLPLLAFFSFISYHENTHQEIFRTYGIDSEIKYFNFNSSDNIGVFTATTTPLGNYSLCDGSCWDKQDFTDIIGYHIAVLLISLWSIAIFILVWKT